MKQASNGNFIREAVFEKGYPSYEAVNRESYYDYMMRRSREEDGDKRTPEQKIMELTDRIKKLEVDMAHVLSGK
jgi:hypothetical protein